jgi:glutamine synthetase
VNSTIPSREKRDASNADFVANLIEMKQKEYDALRLRPHPYEFAMYYDV